MEIVECVQDKFLSPSLTSENEVTGFSSGHVAFAIVSKWRGKFTQDTSSNTI